jgi:2-polyprenyl-3-methyl-5-hydroxy-6-metoxy-1,4-benzoquinol methylase
MTSSDTWFESWFDSPLYEKLYASRDDAEAAQLTAWIAGLLPPAQHPDVLDMGCGRGRHSLLLAKEGYRVTGVDLSSRAIETARRKAAESNITNVRFLTGNMSTWQGRPFHIVCNLFTSFGYFEDDDDNLRVIRNMQSNLKEGGFLVMDYLNPEAVQRNLVPEETVVVGEMSCRITRHIEDGTVVKSLSFVSSSDGKAMTFQERVKLYGREWFESAFTNLGMTMQTIRGDYSGGAFDPLTSPRMVMVVRKKQADS